MYVMLRDSIRMVRHQDEALTIPMLAYWKWGGDTGDGEVPSHDEPERARERCGYNIC